MASYDSGSFSSDAYSGDAWDGLGSSVPSSGGNKYFGQNFLKAQYFNANYLHGTGQAENEGRSGYYRLFFMKMQEEALKQYKEKTGKEVAEPVVTEVVAKQPAPKKVKKSKPDIAVVKPVSKPLPIYKPVKDATGDLMKSLWLISSELHVTMLQIPQYITLLNAKQLEMQQAANDADVRIRLLLLAA